MNRFFKSIIYILRLTFLFSIIGLLGCQPTLKQETKNEVSIFRTWHQFDANNEDPNSDEHVGNSYLREAIEKFNKKFEGKWQWVNDVKAWDKIPAEVIAAVISGGDVPDIIEMNGDLAVNYISNAALEDLSSWAKEQPWFNDIDSETLTPCIGPDGKLYCIPLVESPYVTYVWADRYPNGYPETPEQFLKDAERIKNEGFYAWTYFGSTANGGVGAYRMIFGLISSFGGKYDDGKGNMLLNTPENIAAIEFLRATVVNEYSPDTVFAGGYVEEESFKDSTAGAFPTGLWGYLYLNPLTAPDGTHYNKNNENDLLDAINAGDMLIRPMFAPEGNTPGCNLHTTSIGIPKGAINVEAAHDFINWMMTDQEQYLTYVLGPGGGYPTLISARTNESFNSLFYLQLEETLDKSNCSLWSGSLTRPNEAAELIMNVIYKLIKEDPSLDIATELTKTQNEYNNIE